MLNRPPRSRRIVVAVVSACIAIGAGMATTDSVSAAGVIVEATPPDTEPPPVTEAPAVTTPPDSEDDNSAAWLLLILGLGGLIIAIVVIVSALTKRDTPARVPAADAYREQNNVMGAAQWFQDQLALQLMAAPPDQALQRWSYERRRIESIVVAANQQAHRPDDPWYLLANSVTALMGSLDTALSLRGQHPTNATAVAEADNTVGQRRRELQGVLTTMWPMVQGY